MEPIKSSRSPLRIVYEPSDVLRTKIVVSKKVAAKAVDRNRIKRIIKEALTRSKQKGSFVFIVKTNIRDLKTQDMSTILRNFFKKI